MSDVVRPLAHVHTLGRTYRDLWRRYSSALHDARAAGTWPAYCFGPEGLGERTIGTEPGPIPSPGPIIDALAAWRPTQGVYRFHARILDALWETPLEGELPAELMRSLPEWCVYVETPQRSAGRDKPIHGFYAHVVRPAGGEHDELRLVLDYDSPRDFMLDVERVPLVGTLDESLRKATCMELDFAPKWLVDQIVEQRRPLASLVSVALYLCSEDAELRDAAGANRTPCRPSPTTPRRKGRISKLPAASSPTVWETAFDLGVRFNAALGPAPQQQGDPGRTVRPHMRRAHWHSYWVGPRGEQRRIVRWIYPFLVNADEPV